MAPVSHPTTPGPRWEGPGIPLALGLITVVAFLPSLWNGFVDWDDHVNLINNPNYRGLGWRELRWMGTAVHLGHYDIR